MVSGEKCWVGSNRGMMATMYLHRERRLGGDSGEDVIRKFPTAQEEMTATFSRIWR